MAEKVTPTTAYYFARLEALRDVQNAIDGLNSPMAIRRAIAEMVQQAFASHEQHETLDRRSAS